MRLLSLHVLAPAAHRVRLAGGCGWATMGSQFARGGDLDGGVMMVC